MAKRSGAANLVGLAALGALGYKMLQNKKGDATSGAESVLGGDVSSSKIESGMGVDEYARDNSNAGMYEREPGWESKAAPPKAAAPKPAPSRSYKSASSDDSQAVPTPKGGSDDSQAMPTPKGGSGGGRGPAFGEREAYEATRYKPRYTPPGQAPKFNAGARYPMTSLTREDVLRSTEPEYSSRMKKGGAVKVKKMASGGMTTSSASKRADGIATKGKTRGKMY